MLGLEIEVLMGWTEEHLTAHGQQLYTERFMVVKTPDFDPILIIVAP